MSEQVHCGEELTPELLECVGRVLRMLAHPDRLKIVQLLDGQQEAPVHEISETLRLPQAATSQHLHHMKYAGIVSAERRGKEVWYKIDDDRSIRILNCIRSKKGK